MSTGILFLVPAFAARGVGLLQPGSGKRWAQYAAHVPGRRSVTAHFRPDIEGLRAVAVLMVLAFHAGLPFVPGGFAGVDVFFVISGVPDHRAAGP